MKIVFLYTEIAEYFLACCKALVAEQVDVHVVRYPVNKEAPFQFQFDNGITIYERKNFSDKQLLELVDKLSPEIIVCSGWIDKGYLNVCKKYKKSAITILTLDNHWRGDIKQRLAAIISPFFLHKRFTFCWVPGDEQYKYAVKLGFKTENILKGFYSCDFDLFYEQYLLNKEHKYNFLPKRFIYVGRYYEFKGIRDLWSAFIDLQNENPNEWELWCLGTGDIEQIEHDKIKHFGFVQPKDMPKFIKDTSVFVLPSHFEPWGVVVHEFASAGFPIICSDRVGARNAFVKDGVNGFIYKSGNIIELKKQLLKIINLKTNDLNKMSENGLELAKKITPHIWAKQLINLKND